MASYDSPMITSSPKSIAHQVYNTSSNLLIDIGEYIASHRFGQLLFRKVDDLLWTIEKTLQWSVEPKLKPVAGTSRETSKSTLPDSSSSQPTGGFVRPLPWVFFIPFLIYMRVARVCLGIASRLIGKEPATPKEMVRSIHNVRRRLRVIRFRGMRNMDLVKDDASNIAALTSFLTSSPEDDDHGNGSKSDLNMMKSTLREHIAGTMSSGDDDDIAADESVEEYLNRLAKEDEDGLKDPDFRPNSSLDMNTDGSLTSSSEDDDDVHQPSTSKVRPRSRPISIISTDVIEEVSEDSSTLSISTSEEDYIEASQKKVKRAIDELAPYLAFERNYEGVIKGPESALPLIRAVAEARQAQVAAMPEDDRPSSSETTVFTFDHVVASRSGSESTPLSTSLSLSTQSVDRGLVTSTASSAVDPSDHSHDSTMQKMSSLFSIKKKAPKPK